MELNVINGQSEKKKKLTDVQKVILGWKAIKGIPMDDKGWDKVFFKRYSSAAKDLLELFGLDGAMDCMEYIHDKMDEIGKTCMLETVVKLSDMYREKIEKER